MLYRTYRYSQWDGTQEIFGLDAEELMDKLSEEVLKQGDLMRALREMMRQGYQNREGQHMTGLKDLMEQLKNRRRQQLQQYNMDAVVEDLQERLEEIIRTERAGIDRRLEEAQQQVAGANEDERPQQEDLYKLLEQRAGPQPGEAGQPARGRGRSDPRADGIRFHRPGSPADVSGTAGHAEEPDGPEYVPGDERADSGHGPRSRWPPCGRCSTSSTI